MCAEVGGTWSSAACLREGAGEIHRALYAFEYDAVGRGRGGAGQRSEQWNGARQYDSHLHFELSKNRGIAEPRAVSKSSGTITTNQVIATIGAFRRRIELSVAMKPSP